MSLTDDTLIRELADLTERAVPPMALAPAAVVGAGRRRRRRIAAAKVTVVAGLGVVAAAVAVPALAPPDATPPAATAELAAGLVATAADDADIVGTADGDALVLTDGAGRQYTARFDAAEETVLVGEGATAPTSVGDALAGFGAGGDAADEGDGILQAAGLSGDVLVVAGYVSGAGDVRLEWSDGSRTQALDLPTFAVPGAAGRVYVVRIEGSSGGELPTAAVVHHGSAEHRAEIDLSQLQPEAEATAAGVVELAPGVIAVRTPAPITLDDGTAAVDLGIRASTAPEATWPLALVPLTQGELADLSGSAEQGRHFDAGVWVTGLAEPDREGLRTPWVWTNGTASPEDQETRWDGVVRTTHEESGLFVGVVPQRLPDPRVVLYSRGGFALADGSRVPTLEAPVYESPTGDGRLLYTVWVPAASDGVDGFVTQVDATFAIGSDGTVVGGQRCTGLTLDECAEALGPDVYTVVRSR